MKTITTTISIILTGLVILLAAGLYARASDDDCRLQERLSERGYFTGEITCTYGDRTFEAVRKFQIDNGLHVDGIAGEDTRRVLFADREKAAVIIERKAPAPMTDQEEFARCGDEIVEATVERAWSSRGIKGAIKAWEAKVLATDGLGIRYSDYENATDKAKPECLRAGSLAVNCTVRARPCRRAN